VRNHAPAGSNRITDIACFFGRSARARKKEKKKGGRKEGGEGERSSALWGRRPTLLSLAFCEKEKKEGEGKAAWTRRRLSTRLSEKERRGGEAGRRPRPSLAFPLRGRRRGEIDCWVGPPSLSDEAGKRRKKREGTERTEPQPCPAQRRSSRGVCLSTRICKKEGGNGDSIAERGPPAAGALSSARKKKRKEEKKEQTHGMASQQFTLIALSAEKKEEGKKRSLDTNTQHLSRRRVRKKKKGKGGQRGGKNKRPSARPMSMPLGKRKKGFYQAIPGLLSAMPYRLKRERGEKKESTLKICAHPFIRKKKKKKRKKATLPDGALIT